MVGSGLTLLSVILAATGSGGSKASVSIVPDQEAPPVTLLTPSPNIAAQNAAGGAAIPSTFFAVNISDQRDRPTISFGTLGHPTMLIWPFIERARGTYDFSKVDAHVSNAPKDPDGTANIDLTLGLTPGWAASNQSTCRSLRRGIAVGCAASPDNIRDWKDFVTALVNHYNGRTAPHIKYYEIWNEANHRNYWTGSVSQLVDLAAVAYPIIKQDSHSMVITPSMVGDARTPTSEAPAFMAAYLRAGGAQYADIGAFHGNVARASTSPYPLPTETCSIQGCYGSITTIVNSYRLVLDENGMRGKPLFNTEGGFEKGGIYDPGVRAAWLAQYYILQAGLFQTQGLQLVSWFTWGGRGDVPRVIETESRTPTEAGIAYNQVYSWLVGATFSAPCSNAGNLWTCNLTRPGGYQAQIMWDSSQTCNSGNCTSSSRRVPALYVNYRDLVGNKPAAITNHAVSVGARPIILENQ